MSEDEVEFFTLPGPDDTEYWERHRAAGLNEPASNVVPLNGNPAKPGRRWTRLNLNDAEYQVPPDPPIVRGLLYAAKRHVLSGPPESAKTLIAYSLLIHALRDNHPVAIVDFEMGPTASRLLLHELGATDDEIEAIYYANPDDSPTPEDLQDVIDHGTRFALIDAAAGAYDATGLDDNARKDVEAFARQWIRPLFQVGVSTLLLDHVTKNVEGRGKFTIGSERKTGNADIHLGFDALKALSRGGTGMVKVHVHKDRPGFLARPTAAVLDLASTSDTHQISVNVRAPQPSDDGEFKYTIYMEKVSRELEKHEESISLTRLEEGVQGRRDTTRKAIDSLIADGYAVESKGPRNARLFSLLKPYRKPEDDHAPTTPHHAPGGDTTTAPDHAPPSQGSVSPGGVSQADGNDSPRPDENDDLQDLIRKYDPSPYDHEPPLLDPDFPQ